MIGGDFRFRKKIERAFFSCSTKKILAWLPLCDFFSTSWRGPVEKKLPSSPVPCFIFLNPLREEETASQVSKSFWWVWNIWKKIMLGGVALNEPFNRSRVCLQTQNKWLRRRVRVGGGLVLEPLNVGGGDSNSHPSFVKKCQFFGQRANDKTDRFFSRGGFRQKKSVFDQKWFFWSGA